MSRRIAYILAALALITAACFSCYYGGKRAAMAAFLTQVDTLLIYDTIELVRPVLVRESVRDTTYVAVSDTVTLHDTTFIRLPREEKVYSDSTYYAVVSGFHPSLDTLRIFSPTTYISSTQVERAPRWSLGVTTGPGLLIGAEGRIYAGWGLTLGVQYRF